MKSILAQQVQVHAQCPLKNDNTTLFERSENTSLQFQ